jgi:TatD DNase family protein
MIDSHCHLADETFAPELPEVIARAKAAGLERALVILEAAHQSEAAQAQRIETLWPEVRLAVGVHPHVAHTFAADPERAATVVRSQIAETPLCRAVGEIGLDYHYDFSPREVQREVFVEQLRLAKAAGKPIIIHTREAWEDTLEVLHREWSGAGIIHCFTGDEAQAREALAMGFHLSFGGVVTFNKAENVRQAASIVPDDRLLVETDAPYLAPIPYRGKRNEPAFMVETVKKLADVRGVEAAHIAAMTSTNFERLMGLTD